MRKLLVLVSVTVLIALIGATTAACKKSDDEALVQDLIYRIQEAWKYYDYPAMYKMMSPDYRETASYEEFEEYVRGVAMLMLRDLGTTEYEISDIEVRIEDSWAFVSYTILVKTEVIDLVDEDDIYRKVGGKWYDVTEDSLLDPGYNEEDLPPGYY